MAQRIVRNDEGPTAMAGTRRRARWHAPAFTRTVVVAALVVDLVVAAALSAWMVPDVWPVALAVFDMDQAAGTNRGVNLTEVARHPEVMLGRSVTISGRVFGSPGDQTLTIGTDVPFVGDRVAIVYPDGINAVLAAGEQDGPDEGDLVRVTGEVRLRDDIAATVGRDLLEGGKGALIAESIEVNPEVAYGPGDKELPFWSDGYDLGLTAYDIAYQTDDHLGMTVTVSGEIEEQVLTDHTFVLSDHAILIVIPEPQPDVFTEATAYVTGEVRRFDRAEIEAELGVELDDRVSEWEGKPTIVARTVEVVA